MCRYGRLCGAGRLITRSAAVVLSLGSGSVIVLGDEPAKSTTIVVFGDSQAQGLADGLSRVLVEDTRYRVLNRTLAGAALVHGESEWLRPIERFTSREKADIAVVLFGANDRLDLRDDDGSYLHFRTDAWRAAYAARADEILALLANAKLRVIWCGNPLGRNQTYSADMGYINDIYAKEAAKFGGQFISLWTVIADDQGRYAAYGKDRDGTCFARWGVGGGGRHQADDPFGDQLVASGSEMNAVIGPQPLGRDRAARRRRMLAQKSRLVGHEDQFLPRG